MNDRELRSGRRQGNHMALQKGLYTTIPYVNKKISRIFAGTAFPPIQNGKGGEEIFEAALANGINSFDTARVYQYSERMLGNWLEKSGKRDEVVILSKCGHPSPLGRKRVNENAMRKDLEKSLKELKTDYIDIYLLHRDDPETEVAVAVETFNAMHAEGRIGAFGGSNWTHTRIEEANEYAYKHDMIPFSVSSPNFGLARQLVDVWGGGCVSISGPENEEARAWYEKSQMPVIAYSSLGRGVFSGKIKSTDIDHAQDFLDSHTIKGYVSQDNFERLRRCELLAKKYDASVAQIAMSWIFAQPLNTFAVASMSSAKRMQANVEALHIALTPEEAAYLDLKIDLQGDF